MNVGYMKYDFIIVNSGLRDDVKKIDLFIRRLTSADQCLFRKCGRGLHNGVVTYFMSADGSEEGGTRSNHVDVVRERFIKVLNQCKHTDWARIVSEENNPDFEITQTNQNEPKK